MADLATTVCVTGGGPAGMMLGYLLARAGIDVTVLEKHADFLRDFRGDTVHASTLEIMHELGILDEFLERPHNKMTHANAVVAGEQIMIADLTHLPTRCKFIVIMPQWDFLNFIVEKARALPNFKLLMQANVTGLIEGAERIEGVVAQTPQGELHVRAQLVVGADGRHSTLRDAAHLPRLDLGAPIDVLWMRLSQKPGDPVDTAGYFLPGTMLVLIDRETYWQCAYVIPKGMADAVRSKGIEAFRVSIASAAPFLADRVDELKSFDDVKLLSVRVDRLLNWSRPGLLCIGDAAHAMSPVGGVGINLAIQDAVAAANILAKPLLDGTLQLSNLQKVQKRRELAVKLTQAAQIFMHKNFIYKVLTNKGAFRVPWPMRILHRFPYLARFTALPIAVGFRPEHVKTKDFIRLPR